MKNDEILHKWVNGDLTPEERKAFEERPEYISLEALQRQMEQLSGPELKEDVVLTNVLAPTKSKLTVRKKGNRHLWRYAAAAAILLLLGFFTLRPPASSTYNTQASEQLTHTLPDQSTVTLNANSELRLQEARWPEERVLQLDGEAYFAVRDGSTFKVETPSGVVRVLGTGFSVNSRNGILEVSCFSGKVLIEYFVQRLNQELTIGEAIRFTPDAEPLSWSIDTDLRQPEWLDGITRLRAVPLQRCIHELERQFGLPFKTNNVDLERVVTVNFQHQNLEQALQTVFSPLNIRYETKPNQEVHLFQE